MYESKSPFDAVCELSKRLGVSDEVLEMTDEEFLRQTAEGFGVIPDYDTLKKKGYYKYTDPEPYSIVLKEQIEDPAHHPFPTPSGKIEIYSQLVADMNNPLLPPIPKYLEPWESSNDPLAAKYPLKLITSAAKHRAHSQHTTTPWLKDLVPHRVLVSSADAMARGIVNDALTRVFNDRGEILIKANVTEMIMPGVVEIPQGAPYEPDENGADRGGCANVLTRDDHSPCGAFVTNGCLVQLEKV